MSDSLPTGIDLTIPLSTGPAVRGAGAGDILGRTEPQTSPATVSLQPPTGSLTGLLEMDLTATAPVANQPIILIGRTGGSAVQTNSFAFGVALNITWNTTTATADPSVTFAVKGGKVIIDTTDADGFLADVLSGVNVQAGFDFAATWRADTGLHVTGGAQLEIDLPLHLDLGPVTLRDGL